MSPVRSLLDPLPPGCRTLTDPERARLAQQEPDLWENPANSCLTCQKTGTFKARRAGGEVVEVTCDCTAQWKLNRWLLNAGIGLRYQRYAWDHADAVPHEIQMAVLDYAHHAQANISSGTGLTLWSSDSGTGKTLMATLLLKTLLAHGHDGYFTQFNEMLDFSTNGWRDVDERAWFTRKVRNTGVLVIDDIGREYKGKAEMTEAIFDSVIRARVAASRPTIITTNFTPENMHYGYGGNILSLLSEVNGALEMSGKSYRPRVHERMVRDRADGITVYPIVVG